MNFEVLLYVQEMECYSCNIKIFSWYHQSNMLPWKAQLLFSDQVYLGMMESSVVISFEPKLLLASLTNYLPDYSRNDGSEAILFLVSMKVGS